MSNIRLLGFPNETAQSYTVPGTVSSSFDPAEMGPAWLKTNEPSDRARKTILDPKHTQFGFATSLVPLTVQGLAACNHNVTPGGQIRFVGWGGTVASVLNIPSATIPSTVIASTNLTGAVTDIDEAIDSPDGLNMGPTNTALPWSVTLRFGSTSGTLNTGADMFALVLRVRRVFVGGSADTASFLPKLTASLAAPALPLGSRAVTRSTAGGQLFIFPFRRSDFTSTTDIQATLAFAPGLDLSAAVHYAVLETAAVYYETVTLNSPTLDSGWITWTTDNRAARTRPNQHAHYFPPAAWGNVIAYGVQIRSDQAEHLPRTISTGEIPAATVPTDPSTFVEVGVFPAGGVIAPEVGVRKGGPGPMGMTADVTGLSGLTAGGQSYGADAFVRRVSPPLELIVTRDELLQLQNQIAIGLGTSGAFYVAVEPDVAQAYQTATGYWATLKGMSEPRPLSRYKAGGSMKFTVDLTFQEKL